MSDHSTYSRERNIAQSIFDLVGNTPLLEVNTSETPPSVDIYGKLEEFQPVRFYQRSHRETDDRGGRAEW